MRNRCILLGVDILTASCLRPHKPEYAVPDGILVVRYTAFADKNGKTA